MEHKTFRGFVANRLGRITENMKESISRKDTIIGGF